MHSLIWRIVFYGLVTILQENAKKLILSDFLKIEF